MRVTLRPATSTDALPIAQLLIDVRSRFMPYAPAAHSDDEIRSWVKTLLLPNSDTVVVEANGQLRGAMVTTRESECSWIKQMAVDPNYVGRGIGSTLISYAFRVLP